VTAVSLLDYFPVETVSAPGFIRLNDFGLMSRKQPCERSQGRVKEGYSAIEISVL